MMCIFHLALVHVGGHAHVVMGCKQEATSLSRQKLSKRLDLFARRFLLRDHMVKPKTIMVSVSARMRSSIGSFCPAWSIR